MVGKNCSGRRCKAGAGVNLRITKRESSPNGISPKRRERGISQEGGRTNTGPRDSDVVSTGKNGD